VQISGTGSEIREPAIIEFGGLELIFLRHLPKLVRHLLVAGEVCIPSAHNCEFERFTVSVR
jgi:hypothetical protein